MFGFGKKKHNVEFEFDSHHEFAPEHSLIERYVSERFERGDAYYAQVALKDTTVGTEISGLNPNSACKLAIAVHQRIEYGEPEFKRRQQESIQVYTDRFYRTRSVLFDLFGNVLRRKLPFTSEQIKILLGWLEKELNSEGYLYGFGYAGIIKAFKDYADRGESVETLVKTAKRIADTAAKSPSRDTQKHGDRILKIIGLAPKLPLKAGEAWADAAIGFVEEQSESDQSDWSELVAHCASVNGGKPTKKWSKTACDLVESVGQEKLTRVLQIWFLLIDKPRTVPILEWSQWAPDPNLMIDDQNADILKGLVWLCGVVGDDQMADSIGKVALSAYRKVPGVGPRATKVGNACVWALGQIPGESSLAALAILKVRVKYKPAQKGISSSLTAAAERAGMTPEELEEIGIPAYGMEEVGTRRETLGEHTAILTIVDAKKTVLTWESRAGKKTKTVPKPVREHFADDLKVLRQAGKDIQKMLSAQRERIDNLFLNNRVWKYEDWVQRYIKHPLVGVLGQRLIWSFETGGVKKTGMWFGECLVGSDGSEIPNVSECSAVALWHPVGADMDTVVAWRQWIEKNQITQPFKQAHREIYLLTEAEENTEVYSNRYASHVIKQHQFNALCAARGWRHSLRLMVDDNYEPPSKHLPRWNLRAEFWVEGIGDDYGTDTTEAGSYVYLATDQVRFYREDAARNSAHAGGGGYYMHGRDNEFNAPVPLRDIDPLALSEVFRDVDLFVGVASVGNDPTWSDGGPNGRFVDYWNSYSFGALNESANTRKAILENLIPRLKIRDQCKVQDRFLYVQGDIRAYKIHLGSGNVLMEPNDQYLCIVAAQGKAAPANSVFLPFEGDNRMALILSKAFLLADDKNIKDRTILSQIRP